jgi:Outer membrane protein beta-barrel domain
MKKALAVLFLIFCMMKMNAQQSYFKTGLNLNATFFTNHSPGIKYESSILIPGLNVAYEKPWGKKFSFTYNFDFSRHTVYTHDPGGNRMEAAFSRISFTPEVRYYPLKSKASFQQSKGLFIQSGIQLISYSFMQSRMVNYGGLGLGDHHNIFLGIGVKYPFSDKTGMEIHINTSPYNLIMSDNWNNLQTGFKFFWTIDKPSKNKKSNPAVGN